MRRRTTQIASCAFFSILVLGCVHHARTTALSREQAIVIAKAQVRFEPFEVDARQASTNRRRVWRVVLKGRLPGQPPMLFETAIVEIDAATGAVVSVGKT